MTEVMLRDSAVNNKETASPWTKKSENTPLNKQLKYTRRKVSIVLNPNIWAAMQRMSQDQPRRRQPGPGTFMPFVHGHVSRDPITFSFPAVPFVPKQLSSVPFSLPVFLQSRCVTQMNWPELRALVTPAACWYVITHYLTMEDITRWCHPIHDVIRRRNNSLFRI
jgi:hypothetical protein